MADLQARRRELELENERLRRARTAYASAPDRYAELFEVAPAGHVTLDAEGVVVEANPAAAALLGAERESLVGSLLAGHVGIDSRSELARHLRATVEGVRKDACRVVARRRDGTARVVRVESVAVGDEPRQCHACLFDVTEEAKADEELRRLNDRLEDQVRERTAALEHKAGELSRKSEELERRHRDFVAVAGNVPALISYIDPAQRFRFVNRRYEELFEQPASRILGHTVAEILGKPTYERVRPHLEAALGGKEAACDVEYLLSDGPRTMLERYVPDRVGGEVRGTFALITDITDIRQADRALRESEARLRSIVDNAIDAIITIDERGIVESFSPAAERLFGYAADEVVGRNVSMLMPSPHSARHDAYIADYLRTGQARIIGIGREVEARRKDGTTFPADLAISVLEVDSGRAFLGVLRDLTQKKRLEAEFVQAQKMEAVGRLAAGVAHDFNNLLAGIGGGLRIAVKELDESYPARGLLFEVIAEVARGTSLTRRLLDFSRVETPRRVTLDPRDVLESAQPMIQRLLGEDVDVRLVLEPSAGRVLADASELEQAVLNLAINGRDAMPRGGVLEIRCADADLSAAEALRLGIAPGAFTVVSVRDTGCGMDEATRRKAADAFFTTKAPGVGTGLGLASVASLMKRHEGYLVIETEVGAGTTARLFFQRDDTASEADTATAAGNEPRAAPRAAAGECVLVVEDEALVRRGVQHMLEGLGYAVLAAHSSLLALELLRTGRRVDLLLTDVVLPEMSGPELAAQVVREFRGTRVLYMSAFPGNELVAQGRIPPGTSTLEKPFSEEELARKMRELLDAPPAG